MEPNENTGRWTQEEHERFIQGLELYGKKWTKVAEVVRTRTTVQVRSHAQKYFQKVVKGKEAGAGGDLCGAGGVGLRKAGLGGSGFDMSSLRIPVPPPLKPYVPPGSADIATGLYHYLSPINIPREPAPTATGGAGPGDAPAPAPAESVPSWYRQGQDIPDLLGQAEQLDWLADSGNHPSSSQADPDADAIAAALQQQGNADHGHHQHQPPPRQHQPAYHHQQHHQAQAPSPPQHAYPPPPSSTGGIPDAPLSAMPAPAHHQLATTPSARGGSLLPPPALQPHAAPAGPSPVMAHLGHLNTAPFNPAVFNPHVTDSGMLPPPPPGPPLEATFSSMEVDESLFEALINDEDLVTPHDDEAKASMFGSHVALGMVEARS